MLIFLGEMTYAQVDQALGILRSRGVDTQGGGKIKGEGIALVLNVMDGFRAIEALSNAGITASLTPMPIASN